MWLNPGGVVVEALLFHCHDSSGTTNAPHIGKIADTATAILQGRGETFPLKAKTAGGYFATARAIPEANSPRLCAAAQRDHSPAYSRIG